MAILSLGPSFRWLNICQPNEATPVKVAMASSTASNVVITWSPLMAIRRLSRGLTSQCNCLVNRFLFDRPDRLKRVPHWAGGHGPRHPLPGRKMAEAVGAAWLA